MDTLKYELLLREVLSLMRGDELDYAQRNMEGLAKVDAVQDLLRNALRKSSLGMFNGVPHCFDGRVYSPLSWSDFSNLVYDVMRECSVPFGFYGKTQSIARVCRSGRGQGASSRQQAHGFLELRVRHVHRGCA